MRAPELSHPAESQKRNQILREMSGGLAVGSGLTQPELDRAAAMKGRGREIHRRLMERIRNFRTSLGRAWTKPATTNSAVRRSSVSSTGGWFLSQVSKQFASGVSVAKMNINPAMHWKTRRDTLPK